MPLSYSSTTIRRVCRSTLQAETYSLQHGLEAGDKLRGVLAEIKGQIKSLRTRETDARSCVPHLALTDCRSLSDHVASEILAKVSDNRLGIELQSIHESYWNDDRKTWEVYPNGGDKLSWIATRTMISDLPHEKHEAGFHDPRVGRVHVQSTEAVETPLRPFSPQCPMQT